MAPATSCRRFSCMLPPGRSYSIVAMRYSKATYLISTFCLAFSAVAEAQSACSSIDLQQNWDRTTKEQFWFKDQGSEMLPYDWYLALEQASSTTLFRDSAKMERLRFTQGPTSTLNPDGLPIGFTKNVDRATGVSYVGLTCAAC